MLAAGEDDRSIGRLRMEGYRQALAENGIPFDPALVCLYGSVGGRVFHEERLPDDQAASGDRDDFTALVRPRADTLAMGACSALKESGVRVPEDCSIMGFDGLEAGRYYIPA